MAGRIDPTHAFVVLHLSHIIQPHMLRTERYKFYHVIASLLHGALRSFSWFSCPENIPRLSWSEPCHQQCLFCPHWRPHACGKVGGHRVHVCEMCAANCGQDCSSCEHAFCNRSAPGHTHHTCKRCHFRAKQSALTHS